MVNPGITPTKATALESSDMYYLQYIRKAQPRITTIKPPEDEILARGEDPNLLSQDYTSRLEICIFLEMFDDQPQLF